MADAPCHYCDRPAEEECPTCGRLYCAEHGEDVCLRCLSPEAAAPSAKAYKGAVVALVAATLVVAYLLIRPPESKSAEDIVRTLPTATPAINATATPTPPGSRTPSNPTASPTSATATVTAPPGQTYTVKAGDTLSGIAAQFNVTVNALQAANPGITAETLQIGATLKIPAPQ